MDQIDEPPTVPEEQNETTMREDQTDQTSVEQEALPTEEQPELDISPEEVTTEDVEASETQEGDEIERSDPINESAPPTQTEIATEGADHERAESQEQTETIEKEADAEPASRDDLFEEEQGPIVSVGAPLSRTTSQAALENGGDVSLEVPSIRPSTPDKPATIDTTTQSDEIVEEVMVEGDRLVTSTFDRNDLISQYQVTSYYSNEEHVIT